jgi:hypothetical protein
LVDCWARTRRRKNSLVSAVEKVRLGCQFFLTIEESAIKANALREEYFFFFLSAFGFNYFLFILEGFETADADKPPMAEICLDNLLYRFLAEPM